MHGISNPLRDYMQEILPVNPEWQGLLREIWKEVGALPIVFGSNEVRVSCRL